MERFVRVAQVATTTNVARFRSVAGRAERAGNGWKVIAVPGEQITMLHRGTVDVLARELEASLHEARAAV